MMKKCKVLINQTFAKGLERLQMRISNEPITSTRNKLKGGDPCDNLSLGSVLFEQAFSSPKNS